MIRFKKMMKKLRVNLKKISSPKKKKKKQSHQKNKSQNLLILRKLTWHRFKKI